MSLLLACWLVSSLLAHRWLVCLSAALWLIGDSGSLVARLLARRLYYSSVALACWLVGLLVALARLQLFGLLTRCSLAALWLISSSGPAATLWFVSLLVCR